MKKSVFVPFSTSSFLTTICSARHVLLTLFTLTKTWFSTTIYVE